MYFQLKSVGSTCPPYSQVGTQVDEGRCVEGALPALPTQASSCHLGLPFITCPGKTSEPSGWGVKRWLGLNRVCLLYRRASGAGRTQLRPPGGSFPKAGPPRQLGLLCPSPLFKQTEALGQAPCWLGLNQGRSLPSTSL